MLTPETDGEVQGSWLLTEWVCVVSGSPLSPENLETCISRGILRRSREKSGRKYGVKGWEIRGICLVVGDSFYQRGYFAFFSCFLQLRFGRKIAGKLGKYAYYKVHDSEGDVWQLINCHFEISVVFVAELTTGTTKWSASCCWQTRWSSSSSTTSFGRRRSKAKRFRSLASTSCKSATLCSPPDLSCRNYRCFFN